MVLEALQTCIRLHSHPGNGNGGNLGGLEEEDLLHFLHDSQADPRVGTARTRPGSGGGDVSSQPCWCLVLFGWLEKLQTGGQWGHGAPLAAAGARGEPGPCTDPESSPRHGREQGSRIRIHLALEGTPKQPCHFIPLCPAPVTVTDSMAPGSCCSLQLPCIFAVLAALSQAKDECSCAETLGFLR